MKALVCIKRVPDTSGTVTLTDDAQSVDGRYTGYTMSDHENCAVEVALQAADEVCIASVGSADSVEQIRGALALGATAAVHVEADPVAFGPADVARELAGVVSGMGDVDLVLTGNDAADTGDFQVPIRLAYALGWPVATGIKTVTVEDGTAVCVGDSPDGGSETYRLPLPAVVAVLEGGVEPRYPTVKGRMAAKKVGIDARDAAGAPQGTDRVKLKLPPPVPSNVEVLGKGPAAAGAVVDVFGRLGVL